FHVAAPLTSGEPVNRAGLSSEATLRNQNKRPLRVPPLIRPLADRQDVGGGLPDFLVGHDVAPGRHAKAPFLSAIGNRQEHTLGIELPAREIAAASAVLAMAMRTLPLQKQFTARRDQIWVFQVRNLFLGMSDIAREEPRNRERQQSVFHGNQ